MEIKELQEKYREQFERIMLNDNYTAGFNSGLNLDIPPIGISAARDFKFGYIVGVGENARSKGLDYSPLFTNPGFIGFKQGLRFQNPGFPELENTYPNEQLKQDAEQRRTQYISGYQLGLALALSKKNHTYDREITLPSDDRSFDAFIKGFYARANENPTDEKTERCYDTGLDLWLRKQGFEIHPGLFKHPKKLRELTRDIKRASSEVLSS